MDALKRASEKQLANETRSRQKVLALQESVKQALAAADDAEEEDSQVSKELEASERKLKEVEKEHERLRAEAKSSSGQAESSISSNQKRLTDLQAELSALTHRLDRLNSKNERLEGETLPEMETELNALKGIYAGLEKGDLNHAHVHVPTTRERDDSIGHLSHHSQLSNGSSSSHGHAVGSGGPGGRGRLQPIGRPSLPHSHISHGSTSNPTGPTPNASVATSRPLKQNRLPQRPGILNVQHILQRTP